MGGVIGETHDDMALSVVVQQIGETELEQELGISNTLHRLKLRLAVQEILTVTTNTKSHRTVSAGCG